MGGKMSATLRAALRVHGRRLAVNRGGALELWLFSVRESSVAAVHGVPVGPARIARRCHWEERVCADTKAVQFFLSARNFACREPGQNAPIFVRQLY